MCANRVLQERESMCVRERERERETGVCVLEIAYGGEKWGLNKDCKRQETEWKIEREGNENIERKN